MTIADARLPTATGLSSSTTLTVNTVTPPSRSSYLIVGVAFSAAIGITGITGGTGTFVAAGQFETATKRVEIWVGYNFGSSAPTSITITRAAGTVNATAVVRTLDVFADTTTAPSFTAASHNTGTSTTASTNALTPAVGDLLVAAVAIGSTSADSTARTHTGNTFVFNSGGSDLTNIRVEMGFSVATSAVSTSEAWTLGSSVEWLAGLVKWTPPTPPAADAGLVVKGLDTAAADAASAF